ncbi:hypothetical protein TSOC_005211 [Tetrabaena socialis]|uniref:RNA ligase domain-containing protein n=1 Tax=Tetrabaena socialis TaxID=47790 RepID=A0A2J8A6S6_9CHLO|nr:hypothetical protein TSOC_005211 [Tetrabaena socialis]|eukprot:PNH08231.1 hypothetical protein TSOC_005211 [Tetrabaena socialis]
MWGGMRRDPGPGPAGRSGGPSASTPGAGAGGEVVVYARTHKHPATHPSFGPVKAMAAAQLRGRLPPWLALFGENMAAVHSIAYESVPAAFFLFGVWDARAQGWYAWEDVERCARELGLHTVPVLHQGSFSCLPDLEAALAALLRAPSSLDGRSPREGFVVRTAASFPSAQFDSCVAKYVRAGHLQTDASWRRTWRPARVLLQPPPPPPEVELVQAGAASEPQPGASTSGQHVGRPHAQSAERPHELTTAQPPQPQPRSSAASDASSSVLTTPGDDGAEHSGGQPHSGQRPSSPPQPVGHTADRPGTEERVTAGEPSDAPAGAPQPEERRRPRGPAPRSQHQRARPAVGLPRLVMLVGLPGSGKSSFGRALEASGR